MISEKRKFDLYLRYTNGEYDFICVYLKSEKVFYAKEVTVDQLISYIDNKEENIVIVGEKDSDWDRFINEFGSESEYLEPGCIYSWVI